MRRPLSLAALLAICTALFFGAGSSPAAPPDPQAPSVPQGMAFAAKTRTTLRLVWRPSTDDVGVTGYRLYRDGARVASVRGFSYTYTGLRCGTRYTVALEAVDAAGNTSYRPEATGSTTTSACTRRTPPKTKPRAPAPSKTASKRPIAGKANLWLDVDGGGCIRSPAPAAYAGARACRSLQA